MMGVYFAATGFGNKLAGTIGESSQLENYKASMIVSKEEIFKFTSKDSIKIKDKTGVHKVFAYAIEEDKNFSIKSDVYLENGAIQFREYKKNTPINYLFQMKSTSDDPEKVKESEEKIADLKSYLRENKVTKENPYHTTLTFEKDSDKAQIIENKGDGKDYSASFVIEEEQNAQEYKIFKFLTIFTVAFGFLLILFLKRLKKLTHGAEDNEHEVAH